MLLLQMLWLTLMIVGMATMTAGSVNFMVIVFLNFGDWWSVYKPMMTQLLYVLVGTVLSDAGMLLPVKMSLGLQAIGALGTAVAFIVIMYWFRQECYSVKTK